MYLKKLKIWNFRCIGSEKENQPGVEIDFDPKLNLLIGANDSGKTAIIDAIRYCLGTQTYDPIRLEVEDFYQNPIDKKRSNKLKIECIFGGFTDEEAGQFLEWIDIKKENNTSEFKLKVWLTAEIKNNSIITNLRAGIDDEGQYIEGEARNLLRVTYLKPLRDAENELTPGYRSRFYQILKSHPILQKKDINEKHVLEKYFEKAEEQVSNFFEMETIREDKSLGIKGDEAGGKKIKDIFEKQTRNFLEQKDERTPKIKITQTELNSILRKLELLLEENKSGLGTLNQLYMAAELIHLQRENYLGIRLALVEELESHLHPQAQLRVLKSLLADNGDKTQYILTTHSTTLGSSIPLKYIKLCYNSQIYSLDSGSTALSEDDYQFLERFLDATKSNLFFAKGVIIVEGDAENILIPTLAEIIGRPLHKYGVSIVNLGSKALLRYANIFKRKNGETLPIKVAVVTDLDLKINDDGKPVCKTNDKEILCDEQKIKELRNKIETKYNSNDNHIKAFISPLKTMEYDIALGNLWEDINKAIHIAKEIKSKGDWITEEEIIKIDYAVNENDKNNRAKIIYEPLEKNRASKTVTAQWFAKILKDNKESALEKIKKDYKDNKGIKYLIEAIEHVTEPLNWNNNGSNNN